MTCQPYLYFDCQTTHASPKHGRILEAAWAVGDEKGAVVSGTQQCALIGDQPPQITGQIRKLTGIEVDAWNHETAISEDDLANTIGRKLKENPRLTIVIHYAQFERRFLQGLLPDLDWSQLNILCSHRFSKLLIQNLPSYSLRAVAGFLGHSMEEKKRSNDHLNGTVIVWQELLRRMASLGISPHDFQKLMAKKSIQRVQPAIKKFGQIISPEIRLGVPSTPGIYRFYDRSRRVLYVGKAKNLKNRVNSYFRGRTSKGSRLNEMLSQVQGLDWLEARSEFEALLLENRTIKTYEPPYNRQLKTEQRTITPLTSQELGLTKTSAITVGYFTGLEQKTRFVTLWHFMGHCTNTIQNDFTLPWPVAGTDDQDAFIHETLRLLHGKLSALTTTGRHKEMLAAWRKYRIDHQRELEDKKQKTKADEIEIEPKIPDQKQQAPTADEYSEQLWQWLLQTLHRCRQTLIYRQLNHSHWIFERKTGGWADLRVGQGQFEIHYPAKKPAIPNSPKAPLAQPLSVTSYDQGALLYQHMRRLWRHGQDFHIALPYQSPITPSSVATFLA
ncbi:GIY-YIG nuclease family protein [Pseudobacteriovorax antillogorgiicola]|uniref:GIY-YIG catalytic domain-containing protein n=1 Tax=Pseudobacteriovorax antillogorgiicola TaxID=1513793 RepID=A0A1Y6BAK8_9BACT|nr:GIY-YIG nuclease family protein [Pseudobacteriovorax antillogorgiicola]TCS57572.1 GIY-YIG catalytic domain-containing protein [Pseudobacteriovorax antillogorgiicola]SME99693.1 GIY-YIG catalytic domain-containing protein [Pseudobacteriovorax antillogorgiicola]